MKASCSVGLLLLVLAGGGQVVGDETAQQPGRDRPAVRRERLDRLRKLGGQLIGSLAGPGDPSGPGQGASLDVSQINRGLEASSRALQAEEPRIRSLRVAFDPERTAFAEDRARIVASAELSSSAWSPAPTRAELALAARVESPDGRQRAIVQGELRLETDCVALAARLLLLAQQNLSSLASPTASRAESAFRARLAEKLERTRPPESMEDLADLFAYVSGLRLTAYNEAVEQQLAELDQVQGQAGREQLMRELNQVRRERDLLFLARPSIVRGADGAVESISVTVTADQSASGEKPERLKVTVTPHLVGLSVSWDIIQGIEWYWLAKPLVLAGLSRLQDGDGRGLAAAAMASPLWKGARKHVFGPLPEPSTVEELPAPAPIPRPQ